MGDDTDKADLLLFDALGDHIYLVQVRVHRIAADVSFICLLLMQLLLGLSG